MDRAKVLQTAEKLVEKKRYDKAIVEYEKLVADDPQDARTLLRIGDLHHKLEQYAESIGVYERAGEYYAANGFPVKAMAVYIQIREIIRKHVPHLEDRFGHIVPKLAEIYVERGLVSDALAAYDEVATRLQRAGRDRDAIDVFRKVVDLDPQNPLPYLRLAEAYARVRDVDNAIECFGVAATILLRLGRQDDALKVVERLLMHRADAKFARLAAEIYLSRGGPNDGMAALTKLQICFKEDPKNLETLALLARTFDQVGQPTKAIEVHKEAARIAQEAGKLEEFRHLVELLIRRAPHDDAVRGLTRALEEAEAQSVSIVEDSVIEEISVVEDDEEPFALRPSQPHLAGPGALGRDPAGAATASDPLAEVRQVLARVEALRRARDYGQALALLRHAVGTMPSSRELRERLCDLLIESGDQDGAVQQMIEFASHLSNNGDVEAAARLLDEVLLLDPDHRGAMQMLKSLGYAVPDQTFEPGTEYVVDGDPDPASRAAGRTARIEDTPSYDPSAPLPSYDLEEVGPSEVLSNIQDAPGPRAEPAHGGGFGGAFRADRHAGGSALTLDDPFASDAPLPSFPIDEDTLGPGIIEPSLPSASGQPLHAHHAHAVSPPSQPPVSVAPASVAPVSAPPASQAPASLAPASFAPVSTGEHHLDEDALEEVEFFAAHRMFDEAMAIIVEQLSRLPNHPLLLEKKREIDALMQGPPASIESGAREIPVADESVDRSFDIAASLDALDALDNLESSASSHPTETDPTQISVETVFQQFKAGVAAQVAESDAATHYDLGVAYKEMGLVTDAISEFELASRDPTRECVCQSMIGMMHLEQGDVEAAINAFIRGLHTSQKTTDQELALTYEVGNAYEMRDNAEQALYYFQLVARIDPNYRDPRGSVEERIDRLTPEEPAPARAAVGAPPVADEFDAAFDELFSGDKLP